MNALTKSFYEKLTIEGDCIVKNTSVNVHGYATAYDPTKGKPVYAHRYSLELHGYELIEGLVVDHLCRNTRCVNVMHLEQVTHQTNTLRGVGTAAMRKQQTECKYGHEFSEENTRVDKLGRRICRTCHAGRERIRQKKRREEVQKRIKSGVTTLREERDNE